MTSDRTRFDLTAYPLPKNAQGKTFFDKSPGYVRVKRAFRQLVEDPGLGVLTAEAGVGKTASLRNLCAELPRPDHLVLYLCDTSVSPLDLYRTLAVELGVRPSHRRGQLWADIKKALIHLVDERATIPLVILDEALYLRRHKDTLLLTIEHRAAAAPDPLRLQLIAGDDLDPHLAIVSTAGSAEVEPPSELDRRVLDLLARAGRPLGRSQLRAELHVRNERLGDALSRLLAAGAILRDADRWAVPVPTP